MSAPRRITVPAIRFTDENGEVDTMVPLRDPDGTWWVLGVHGCSYYDDSGHVRRFVRQWLDDDAGPIDTVTAYLALADLMDEDDAHEPAT